jgi:hypothetical protein
VLAKGGGIGIADQMVGDDATDRVNASLDGDSRNLAAGMVQEYERKALSSFLPNDEKKKQA